jgi:hypothetical protein
MRRPTARRQLRDQQGIAFHGIDRTMTIINTARLKTGQVMLEWFRLADARERITLYVADQLVDTL